jgi:predicted hydrolase (HD superfamily)
MLYRTRQVWSALHASVTPEERLWIQTLLSPTEQILFDSMDVVDQRHVLDVAYTCRERAKDWPPEEQRFLYKAALLHDIGKSKGDLTVFRRVLAVFLHYLLKEKAIQLAHPAKGPWRRTLHIYFNHPRLGVAKGKAANLSPELLRLIENHHEPIGPEDDKYLKTLKAADDLN